MVSLLSPAAVPSSYGPIAILILLSAVLAVAMVALSNALGPRRSGEVKNSAYESGMPVIGDARQRFNVKFYLVAMLFLLFDVEIVFLWPWAPLFFKSASNPEHPLAVAMLAEGFTTEFLLLEMVVFIGILLLGYLYAWRRGVFKWN